MSECPYTPEQVEEIKVLDAVSADIQDWPAGLHDGVSFAPEDEAITPYEDACKWTALKDESHAYVWAMPDHCYVRATPISDECGVLWAFWVHRGPFAYCPFSVGVENFEDPKGNPEFERCAWSAWHDSLLVLEAMEEAAKQTVADLNDADFEFVPD